MNARLRKFKKLKLRPSKRNAMICVLAAILVIVGAMYIYKTSQYNATIIDQAGIVNQAQVNLPVANDPTLTPPPDEAALRNNESESKPVPSAPVMQSETSGSAPKPAPEALRVSEVRASGDAFCDDTTYKLGISHAYIFTNGQKGIIQWQIEARRSGVVGVIASGSIQFAEGQHVYEFPLNYRHYVAQPISGDTATRFRVTYPNDMSSQWISPSEVLSGESPCAWPHNS